jgi:hypothetical protein
LSIVLWLLLDVPFFKEVVVMSSTCDSCGYKNNEIKSGGPIPPKGRKITLKVLNSEDLSRDVLKVCFLSNFIHVVRLCLLLLWECSLNFQIVLFQVWYCITLHSWSWIATCSWIIGWKVHYSRRTCTEDHWRYEELSFRHRYKQKGISFYTHIHQIISLLLFLPSHICLFLCRRQCHWWKQNQIPQFYSKIRICMNFSFV